LSYIDHTIGAYLRGSVFFPFYWKYIKHSNLLNYYQELKIHQWNTIEENKKIQQKKLYKLIDYASQNIPYYKRVIQEYNIQFSEDNIFDDIKKFPLLTKDVIREHFDELYKFRDSTYFRNHTSGSTGEPAIFYQDKHFREWRTATKIFVNEWAGRKNGQPMIELLGAVQDILKESQGMKTYLSQQFYAVTTLNSYMMTEKNMYDYVRKINNIKPCLIYTYTNSIDELARFIQNHHLAIYSPGAIMTTAGVLFPEIRKRVGEVFGVPLFDNYGSRETGGIACNCEKNEGLHLMPDLHYVEILDDNSREVNPGESGEIVVTLLSNYTMPLIRYIIEDRGILSGKVCSCGRGFPLLEKVEGRIRNMFKNKQGDLIDGAYFISLIYYRNYVKQLQIIQKTVDYIIINLILKDSNKIQEARKDFKEISKKIRLVMGHETKIKYNIVDKIEPTKAGKHMYTFSQVKD